VTRAIAYLRVSTDSQADKGIGLEVQRGRVTDYATEHGIELVGVVQEAASGGIREGQEFSYEHRPILLGLIERARAGEYDILLIAKYDRLSRDYATLITLERRFRKLGVSIVSTDEQTNGDGAIAEFIRGQLALVAQLERATIRDRLSAGKAARKLQGRHVHGRPPYGYRSQAGILEPVDDEATIIRRIYRDATDGWTPGRIARELNRDGIPSPRGGRWVSKVVRGILANPAYAGERYGVKGAHAAIVSRRAWNAAQRAAP